MRAGAFEAAWAISDAVLAGRDPATRDDPLLPYHERWVWDGQPLAGRHVLVRCYHGLGDTLQFCRYLPHLVAVAASVRVEAQAPLLPLLHQLQGVELHPFDPALPLPPAEADVEIMELAHALRRRPERGPYLAAVPSAAGRGRIGLCWAGGGWDPARDIPPAQLARFLRRTRIPALSLQRGAARALPLPDPLDGSMDVALLARLVAGLDAVVTVDTMVAHLAAALGRPTFVLLKHAADWRWGAGAWCPWYASAQPVRQASCGDWASAVAQLELSFAGDVVGS